MRSATSLRLAAPGVALLLPALALGAPAPTPTRDRSQATAPPRLDADADARLSTPKSAKSGKRSGKKKHARRRGAGSGKNARGSGGERLSKSTDEKPLPKHLELAPSAPERREPLPAPAAHPAFEKPDEPDEAAGSAQAEPESEAEEPTPELILQADLRLVSSYMWRGYDLSRGAPSVQPWVQAELGQGPLAGLTLALWGSAAIDRTPELDEFDVMLGFHRSLTPVFDVYAGAWLYVMPGTESLDGSADDPLAPDINFELFLAGSAALGNGFVQLTYSRGFLTAEGNSLGLFGQYSLETPFPWLTLEPYAQLDYLDEFGAPPGLEDRIAAVEGGLVVHLKFNRVGLFLMGSGIWVTSPYVRGTNVETGAPSASLVPYGAISVAWEAE
jgi:hypothetical protein